MLTSSNAFEEKYGRDCVAGSPDGNEWSGASCHRLTRTEPHGPRASRNMSDLSCLCCRKARQQVRRSRPCVMRLRVFAVGFGLFVGLLQGCVGERTAIAPPAPSGLVVHAWPEPGFSQAASTLNWLPNAVPGALVVAEKIGDTPSQLIPVDSVFTDSAGDAHFAALPSDRYAFRVSRDLTADEQSRAASSLHGMYGLEGFTTATLDATGSVPVSIELRGLVRGSLLISEIYTGVTRPAPGALLYYYDEYLRVYNNSDTTITLAGKLFIDAMPGWNDYPMFNCAQAAQYSADPAGLWAQFIYRFPDNAEALPPGKAVVIATDAINHRQFGSGIGFFDLSGAPYEFRGSADVDNPVAKDMVSAGPRDGGLPDGHGWRGYNIREVVALAMPLAIDTLPFKTDPVYGQNNGFVRVPTAALLDVVQWTSTFQSSYPPCPPAVYSDINAGEARVLAADDSLAMHRQVRFTLPDGRAVLQQSRNSAADFYAARGTPFAVP